MKTFVIGDTHFFHEKALEFRKPFYDFKSVEEMNEFIIQAWNSVVNPEDTVIHLGDVAFKLKSKKDEIKEVINRLHGIKILVPGNHDREVLQKQPLYFEEAGFSRVSGIFKDNDLIFSHEPLEYVPAGFLNVHGHLHSSSIREGSNHPEDVTPKAPYEMYFNASIEQLKDFKPLNLLSIPRN